MVTDALARDGWVRFPAEAATRAWAAAALSQSLAKLDAPGADWRAGRTWFAGLDVLENAPDGSVAEIPLRGAAWDEAVRAFGATPLHRAQISLTRPGYPRRDPGESDASFGFRRNRDAAHVDGLLAVGPERRRMLKEPHAYVLGITLNDCAPDAAPLAVWTGSHRIILQAFRAAARGVAPESLCDLDLTEVYAAARREVFATCPRVTLPGKPGDAVLLHRALLHGVAPWAEGAAAPPEGRAIAYFRPQLASAHEWLARD